MTVSCVHVAIWVLNFASVCSLAIAEDKNEFILSISLKGFSMNVYCKCLSIDEVVEVIKTYFGS